MTDPRSHKRPPTPRGEEHTLRWGAESGAEALQHLARALDTAHDGRAVALFLDHRPDDLEVERSPVPGVEHHRQEALDREVTVADCDTVGHVERAEFEVAHLHEF